MSDTTAVFKSNLQRIENHIVCLEHMIIRILDEMHGFHGEQTDEQFREELRRFKETYQYEAGEPEYGTDAWWDWSDKQALVASHYRTNSVNEKAPPVIVSSTLNNVAM